MNNDDSPRGNSANSGSRNMGTQKYPEKMPNYSPSTAFNYSPGTGINGGQLHPRHRNDRFKRESPSMSDRIVKQNDIIIRLLKEIRDRLPAPAFQEQKADAAATDAGAPAPDPDAAEDDEARKKAESQDQDTFQ
jgi:hypothetical protein